MSIEVLVRATIHNGATVPHVAHRLRIELEELDRGQMTECHFQVGRYEWLPNHLHLTMVRDVGLPEQDPGVPCARLVAEDTLAAIRRVCPTLPVEVCAIELDDRPRRAESHYLESLPAPCPVELP